MKAKIFGSGNAKWAIKDIKITFFVLLTVGAAVFGIIKVLTGGSDGVRDSKMTVSTVGAYDAGGDKTKTVGKTREAENIEESIRRKKSNTLNYLPGEGNTDAVVANTILGEADREKRLKGAKEEEKKKEEKPPITKKRTPSSPINLAAVNMKKRGSARGDDAKKKAKMYAAMLTAWEGSPGGTAAFVYPESDGVASEKRDAGIDVSTISESRPDMAGSPSSARKIGSSCAAASGAAAANGQAAQRAQAKNYADNMRSEGTDSYDECPKDLPYTPGRSSLAILLHTVNSIDNVPRGLFEIKSGKMRGWRVMATYQQNATVDGVVFRPVWVASPCGRKYDVAGYGVDAEKLTESTVDEVERHMLMRLSLAAVAGWVDSDMLEKATQNGSDNYNSNLKNTFSEQLSKEMQRYVDEIKVYRGKAVIFIWE